MDLTTLTTHPFHHLTASEPFLLYVNHKQRDGPVNDGLKYILCCTYTSLIEQNILKKVVNICLHLFWIERKIDTILS